MSHPMILTVLGPDRPAILAGVTRTLFEAGADIKDTSMCILSGNFAMLMVAELPDEATQNTLRESFALLEASLGLRFDIRKIEGAADRNEEEGEGFLITVMDADRPGIVYRITDLIARSSANITDLKTRRVGKKTIHDYVMILELSPLVGFDSEKLEEDLKELASEMNLEIRMKSLDAATL